MFNLILKDLKIQKIIILLVTLWIAFISCLRAIEKQEYLIDFIFLFSVFIGSYSCSNYSYQVEFKYKSKIIIASLPIKDTTIVASKFISLLISTLLFSLLFYIISLILFVVLGTSIFPSTFILCVTLLLNTVTLGLSEIFNFAGDYKKSSFSRMFMFMGFMGIMGLVKKIDPNTLNKILDFFSNNLFLIGVLFVLISILISYIFYIISLSVYRKNLLE